MAVAVVRESRFPRDNFFHSHFHKANLGDHAAGTVALRLEIPTASYTYTYLMIISLRYRGGGGGVPHHLVRVAHNHINSMRSSQADKRRSQQEIVYPHILSSSPNGPQGVD